MRMCEAQVGSPRLRLGPLKMRSGFDCRKGSRRSPSRDGSTRRKGLRFAAIALRATSALAPGAKATPDGERRDPQTAQQPMAHAAAQRKDGPGSTPLRRSPPKGERRLDSGPLGGDRAGVRPPPSPRRAVSTSGRVRSHRWGLNVSYRPGIESTVAPTVKYRH